MVIYTIQQAGAKLVMLDSSFSLVWLELLVEIVDVLICTGSFRKNGIFKTPSAHD